MNENKRTPQIRFKGFTDDWEQRKFETLCSIVTKQTGFDYTSTIKKSLLTTSSSDTIPYLQTKNFSGINIDYNTDYFIPKSIAKDFPKINLNEKCILFSIVGASVGNIGFFPGKIHCFLSGAICVSKFLNPDDAEYLYHFMCSNNGQNQIQTCTKGGAQATVTIEDIRNFNVNLSSQKETIKIGKFLTNIDNLIALHQRKYDKLVNMKKSMLEKMFPKNSEKVPEIRFKGFTDDWEQRKLEQLFVKGGSGGTPTSTNSEYYNGEISILRISDITNSNGYIYKTEKSITNKGLNSSSAWIVPKESISLAMYASVGKLAILKKNVATSQAFYNMVFHDNNIRNIVFYRLNLATLNREWDALISTGTQANLNADKVKSFEISIPNDNVESKKIGELFNNIDNLITLHQRKLERLNNLKKSMLEKMFV